MDPLSFFKCLADDTRLKTILLIHKHKELCVCDLTDLLELSQPKVSRHLAEIRKCNILQAERRGKWVYYSIAPSLLDWAKAVLEQTLIANTEYLSKPLEKASFLKIHKCC